MKEQLLVLREMLDEMIMNQSSGVEIKELIDLINQMESIVKEHESKSKETCSLCGKELHGVVTIPGKGLCKDCLANMEAQSKKELTQSDKFISVAPSEVKVGDELRTPMFDFAKVSKVETYSSSDMVRIEGVTTTGEVEVDFFTSDDVLLVKNTFKRVLY